MIIAERETELCGAIAVPERAKPAEAGRKASVSDMTDLREYVRVRWDGRMP